MAGVAVVFCVVLFFSLVKFVPKHVLRPFFCALKMSSSSKKGMGKRRTGFILWSSHQKLKIVVNTQKSSSQNFSSFTKGDNIYNQSSSLVCAPFLHRLYLFIGCERERERERGRDRLAIEHVRADRIENRIDIDRLFIIDRFSSRARGVVPREKAAVRVDVGLSRLSYRSIARAFFLSSIGRK